MDKPHPPDCPCCNVVVSRRGAKSTRQDADLSAFLPSDSPLPPPPPEDEGEEQGREEHGEDEDEDEEDEDEDEEEEGALIHDALFKSFDVHVEHLDAARRRRIEVLSFKSAVEDDGKEEVNEDASLDEIDGLGVWMPGDEFQGDVNMRTLQRLLTRIDQRGFERSAQQLEASPNPFPFCACLAHVRALPSQFHVAFMKAAARVIYRGSWETERPAIMKKYGWETSNSEVLIRRVCYPLPVARRASLTGACLSPQYPASLWEDVFVRPLPSPLACARAYAPPVLCGSIAIFCACLALSFGLEIVVFSEHSLLNLCSQQCLTPLSFPTLRSVRSAPLRSPRTFACGRMPFKVSGQGTR